MEPEKGTTLIDSDVLSTILLDMFEFAPVAMSISSVGYETSRYLKVNPAYLRLLDRTWDDLKNQEMVAAGAVINGPARMRRLQMLDEQGGYTLEEVEIRRADGTIIPTLMSARRSEHNGEKFDVEIIIDISDRVRIQQDLEYYLKQAAMSDPLTGLPNRAHFDHHLENSLAEAPRTGEVVGLAFLDVNHFKWVNDNFGHDVGDQLLQAIAERLRTNLRDGGFAARLGGDEFALVFKIPQAEAEELLAYLHMNLPRIFEPFDIGGRILHVGTACGVAIQEGEEDVSSTLLKRADRQMYKAKASGKFMAVQMDRIAAS